MHSPEETEMKTTIGVALGALILLIVLGVVATVGSGSGSSIARPTPVPTPMGESSSGVALNPVLTISIDDTVSIQDSIRKEEVEALVAQLPGLIKKQHFGAAQIVHFGDVGWVTPRKDIPLPQQPADPCAGAGVPDSDTIFRQQAERERKRAAARCSDQLAAEERAFDEQLSAAIASVREALDATPHEGAPCTAFYDMLANIAQSDTRGLAIILSDAMETCGKAAPEIPSPKPQVQVVLVMLPSRYDLGTGKSAFATFNKRKAMLESLAPWLTVVPPNSESIKNL
jgi:hypothetical protein